MPASRPIAGSRPRNSRIGIGLGRTFFAKICSRVNQGEFLKHLCAPITIFILLIANSAQCDDQNEVHKIRWLKALLVQVNQVSPSNKRTTQSMAAITLTELRRDAEAKSLAKSETSEEIKHSLLLDVVRTQARKLRFDDALTTIEELPEQWRERATRYVAVELARAGHIDRAVRFLEPMTDGYNRDQIRAAIAKHLAKKEKYDAAALHVAAIEDEYRHTETRDQIARIQNEDPLPIEKLAGPLRGQVSALTAFSSKGTYDTAISAIVAAQAGDREKAIRFASHALAEAKQPDLPPRDLTSAILAAVVYVELDDSDSAKEIVQNTYTSSRNRGIALTSFFGKPILMGLMVRLEHFEAIDAILEEEHKDYIDDPNSSYLYTLTAAAQALVEFEHFEKTETRLESLVTADEKASWLMGALIGIVESGPTKK